MTEVPFPAGQGRNIFLFTTASIPDLKSTQHLNQQVLGTLSLRVEWVGCEGDHSPKSSAKVKNTT
jgi:hypothetical protein